MQSRKVVIPILAGVVASGTHAVTWAQQPSEPPPQGKSLAASVGVMAYPAKKQKPEQQSADEKACYDWSMQQTGYDPMAPQQQPAPPAQSTAEGSRARGAARGAAAGAVVGGVAGGEAGKGAAIGATAGVLAGGRVRRQAETRQQEEAARQAEAAQQQQLGSFKQGMSACLESRGYTVK